MKARLLLGSLLVLGTATSAPAQRPRSVTDSDSTTATPATPAPTTFQAKYEGGVFGYNNKMNGTLTFDDANNRLLFRDKKGKEVLSIPYNAISAAYGDDHSVRPKSATIASQVPYVGFPAQFIRHKVQYLTLQFNDPDSNAGGITSFKVANKALLASVLSTLAGKARLTQRGQVFVKKK